MELFSLDAKWIYFGGAPDLRMAKLRCLKRKTSEVNCAQQILSGVFHAITTLIFSFMASRDCFQNHSSLKNVWLYNIINAVLACSDSLIV